MHDVTDILANARVHLADGGGGRRRGDADLDRDLDLLLARDEPDELRDDLDPELFDLER